MLAPMTFEPLLIDEDQTKPIFANAFCRSIFKSYPAYYYKVGYNPPWIGYFAIRDGIVVGVGGFVGKPLDGRVEIAYGTSKEYEGQGVASFSCRQLISIAKAADPALIIFAKTAPEHNGSTKILQRNGFEYTGIVQDHEIGDAWEWTYKET
jgi:[ribosomal protein S5]-alanine N-acetyltransferase